MVRKEFFFLNLTESTTYPGKDVGVLVGGLAGVAPLLELTPPESLRFLVVFLGASFLWVTVDDIVLDLVFFGAVLSSDAL